MSSFCVFVKPTASRPNSTFVSLQRSGPVWKGERLRLERPDEVGLRYPVLIGWSDFYGGTPAPVGVAWATDGERSGWVVWGGSQGLRAVPEDDEAAAEVTTAASYDERPLLWLGDARMLPPEVAAIVGSGEVRSGARSPASVRVVGDGRSTERRPGPEGLEAAGQVDERVAPRTLP